MSEIQNHLRRANVLGVGMVVLGFLLTSIDQAGSSAVETGQLKVAISSAGEAGGTLADLLIAELAGLSGVTVLERAELRRVVGEQALSGGGSAAGLIRAGALLGADAIIDIDAKRLSRGSWAALRIIDVRRGAAVGWWEYTIGEKERLSWPKVAATQLNQLLAKVSKTQTNLSSLSFVGFRSPASSKTGTAFEREINSLLLNRLQAEPDLLVLERQKLLDAAFEKMVSSDDRAFWNGAYLIQGTINPESIDTNSVTLAAGLAGAGESNALQFVVSGSRTNLSEIAEKFVSEVHRVLHRKPGGITWNATAEARRFYEQAESAVRWKFWPEAASAADTALALGKDDLETRCLRVQAYSGLFRTAFPEVTWPVYRPKFGVLERYPPAPSEHALERALETSYQLLDLSADPHTLERPAAREATSAALEALGRLTLKYYIGAELRVGHEEELAELRRNMRDFIEAILKTAEAGNGCFELLDKFGPLWYETPEEGVKLHKGVHGLPAYQAWRERNRAVFSVPGQEYEPMEWTPSLCGWKWSDRSRVDKVWEEFNRRAAPQQESVTLSTAGSTVPGRMETQTQRGAASELERMAETQRQQIEELQRRAFGGRPGEAAAPTVLEGLKNAVKEGKPPPLDTVIQAGSLAKDEDRMQALELLKSSRELPDLRTNPFLRSQINLQAARLDFMIRRKQGTLNQPGKPLKVPSALTAMSLTNIWGFGRRFHHRAGEEDPTLVASVLTLTNGTQNKPYVVTWAEDRLWVYFDAESMTRWSTESGGGSGVFSESIIAGFDKSGCVETNALPARYLSFHEKRDRAALAVYADKVLLFLENTALVCDRKAKTWRDLQVPIKAPRVLQAGARLFLFNAESVLETTEDLDKFTVLASVRRRPALGLLDNEAEFANPRLFSIGNRILLNANHSTWVLEGSAWTRIGGMDLVPAGMGSEIVPVNYGMDEALVSERTNVTDNTVAFRTYHYQPGNLKADLWWAGVPKAAATIPPSHVVVPEPGERRPCYPLVPGTAPFYSEGEHGRAVFPLFGQLFTLNLPFTAQDRQILQFWATNDEAPFTFSLVLPGREQITLFLPRLLLAGGNVFIWTPGFSRIWMVEGRPLLSGIEQWRAKEMETAAAIKSLLARFDVNKNGRLDGEERTGLAKEPALYETAWRDLDANGNNLIDPSELGFFDFNHDGRIEADEHQALLNAISYYAGSLYLFLDRSHDGFLDESETKSYCNAFLLTVPGIFQTHDADKSGKLDLREWTELVADLYDQRLSSGLGTRPPPAPAGREFLLEPRCIERYLKHP